MTAQPVADPAATVTGRRRFHAVTDGAGEVDEVLEPPAAAETTSWPITELDAESVVAMVTEFNSWQVRRNQWKAASGARELLAWLAPMPGETWQQRWLHAEQTLDDRDWLTVNLRGRVDTQLMVTAMGSLIALDVVRPSYRWLSRNSFATAWKRMGHHRSPEIYPRVAAFPDAARGRRREAEEALLVLAKIQAHTGKHVGQVTGQDVLDYRAATKGLGLKHKGLTLCWRWLGELGCLDHSAAELPSARQGRQKTVTETVDFYGVSNPAVRALLIDYLQERRAALDYSSFKSLALRLVKHFWVDIERHHPEVDSLRLPPEVVTAWKQRLAKLPDGSPRADMTANYFAVRGLYIDIAQWAHFQPERWAHMVAPSPITAADTASYTKTKRRQVARIHQETRTLAPVLPKLVAAVENRLSAARAFLAAAQQVEVGETFDHDRQQWRRVRPKASFCYVRPVGDRHTRNLHADEEEAFWGWALVEVLRHTGARIEEVLELTHFNITQYRHPQTGELVPLLHINPSKTDEERMLVAGPELVDVLAAIVKRVRGDGDTIPLVRRWDGYERQLGEPLPHLFQRRHGNEDRVISVEYARAFLNRAAAHTGIHVDGALLRFRPHDFRRIFATDAQASGLPVHIIAQLLGHKSLATTQIYTAIYPEDVIRGHRTFIARRRQLRPGEEYREPTEEEWEEFEAHFVRRKVSLGPCGRAYGTACQHEHACVRCALLRTDPDQIDRLRDIITNLEERIAEAHDRGWLGEAEGLQVSLDAARIKLGQMERQLERRTGLVLLGMPSERPL